MAGESHEGKWVRVADHFGLADRLRIARVAAGLAQQELANAIDVSLSTYQRLESGEREPYLRELRVIAEATGNRLEDLADIGSSTGDRRVLPLAAEPVNRPGPA
jgi:transcriptional regulator with XRE-family HTH domain